MSKDSISVKPIVEKAKRLLEKRRHELLTTWNSGQNQENELLLAHTTNLEDLSTNQRMAKIADQISEREIEQLREVLAAIDRIHNGYYGSCTKCEQPISAQRLKALPEARLCRFCAGIEPAPHHRQ